jgi:hypothetical protein
MDELEEFLKNEPYYKILEGGKTTEQCNGDVVLFNATVFVDGQFNMLHQGDIEIGTLRVICRLIGKHKVYIFAESNEHKPMCGSFDLTALRPGAGMAKPFGKAEIPLEFADIIVTEDSVIAVWQVVDFIEKKLQVTGFQVLRKSPNNP